MTVGEPSVLAIESWITRAYERRSVLALGFFVIHVAGRSYGVRKCDATNLACSYDEVKRRLENRGRYIAPFAEMDAREIATAFRNALYADEQEDTYFGMALADFQGYFYRNAGDLLWAPDGDAAFDDGSYILQFDVGTRVRVIAFKSGEGWEPDPATIAEIWMPADTFYQILQQWCDSFDGEWARVPKASRIDTN